MKTHYKLLLVFLFLPVLIFANTLELEDAITTKEKTIQKAYNVAKNATLKIDNSFGNVAIITWDKNTIEFDIIIRVSGNNDEKVEERLQNIDVDFSATNLLVTATTQIEKTKKSWWNWGGNVNLKLEINYVVKIPITNNIDISNDYGSVTVDTLEGVAKISCDYGKITTKELLADNNTIRFDYSKGSYFEYIKSGKISADFSSYTIAKTKSITIKADYTNGSIEAAESVYYDCDFNGLSIDNVNNVQGKGDYLTLRLGNVYKNANIESDFGSIKIDRIASNAQNLTIASEYAGMTIGYDKDYSFNFEIQLEFASLKGSDDFNYNKKRIESNEKYYAGNYGSPNATNMVKIKSEFGSVSFKKQ